MGGKIKCEFCGHMVKYAAGNLYHGPYCEKCIRTMIDYEKEALQDIAEQRTGRPHVKTEKEKRDDDIFRQLVDGAIRHRIKTEGK